MSRSVKTRILDAIRKLWARPFGERILLRFSHGAEARQFISKLIPMPYLFPESSWRTVWRHKINLSLDISDFVDWYVYFGLKDEALDCLLSQIQSSDIVLDIGTNIGYVSLRCSQAASQGRVFGFEPSSHNFAKAKKNMALNPSISNLTINRIALGSLPGEISLKSGNLHNRGMSSVVTSAEPLAEMVKVLTLDDWFRENKLPKVDLIKLDVEGFELEVLKGGRWVIDTFRPKLFIEVDDRYLRKFDGTAPQIYHWLKAFDYRIHTIEGREILDAAELSVRHMDVLALPGK
jgi:FkbM family methyltransferase